MAENTSVGNTTSTHGTDYYGTGKEGRNKPGKLNFGLEPGWIRKLLTLPFAKFKGNCLLISFANHLILMWSSTELIN